MSVQDFKKIMPKRACAGEWRGAGAGGSPQHATFFANQQFRLKLRVTAELQPAVLRLS